MTMDGSTIAVNSAASAAVRFAAVDACSAGVGADDAASAGSARPSAPVDCALRASAARDSRVCGR